MDSVNLKMRSVEVKVGTREVRATLTREAVKDIYKMSGMINTLRKKSIEKILNYNKHS